jgi:hypothetical protein
MSIGSDRTTHVRLVRGVFIVFVQAVGLSCAGCGYSPLLAGYTCDDPDEGHVDADGREDPCHRNDSTRVVDAGSDSGPNGPPCQCVPIAPNGWQEPVLVWIGPPSVAPACPTQAPARLAYGLEIIASSISCGACACDPPVGSCTLPEISSTSSALCPGTAPGASHIFFNAPSGWDGSCTSMDAIPGGNCASSPCVQSLTISPLILTQGECTPKAAPPSNPPTQPVWGTVAVSCKSSSSLACSNAGEVCGPAAPPEYRRCISLREDSPCPTGPYSERHLAFDALKDNRGCAPCSCGPAVGNSCTASISVFKDDACTLPLLGTVPVSSNGPSCFDLQPPGPPLGSKSAGPIIYSPGVCQPSGGVPTGSADGVSPTTFCCLPDP